MPTTVADFRRHALALPGAVESSHMNQPDFRLNNQIFATLAFQDKGCGVLKLTLEQQQSFIADLPQVFSPVHGGWGRMGMTLIHLEAANLDTLQGALATAHRNIELKQQSPKARTSKKATSATRPSKSTKPKATKGKSPGSKA